MFYRKMDYSSQEILHFIHHASLEEQIQKVKEKKEYYKEKLNYYHTLYSRNNAFLKSLENIKEDLNSIQIVSSCSYYYLVYRHNYQFNQKEEHHQVLSQWLKYYPIVEDLVMIPKDCLINQGDNDYSWSFAIKEEYFNTTALNENDYVKMIQSQTCIRTIVDAKEQGMFHYHLLDHAFQFIQKHHFQIIGDPFGILLVRTHEKESFHRYIEFFIPIQI